MPVTQYYRAIFESEDAGADITFPSPHPLATATGQTNSGTGSIDDATAAGNGDQIVYLSLFSNKAEDPSGNNNPLLSNEIPNAYISGIEWKIPMVFKDASNGNLAPAPGIKVTVKMIRYVSIIDGQTPSNTSVSNGIKTILSQRTGQDILSDYLGSGDNNDPLNYATIIGGEGDLLGFESHGNTASTFNNVGLAIEYTQGSTLYQLAIGGDTHASGNPSPAVRFYYYYPKTTITTGKLKISSGKYHIKQNSA